MPFKTDFNFSFFLLKTRPSQTSAITPSSKNLQSYAYYYLDIFSFYNIHLSPSTNISLFYFLNLFLYFPVSIFLILANPETSIEASYGVHSNPLRNASLYKFSMRCNFVYKYPILFSINSFAIPITPQTSHYFYEIHNRLGYEQSHFLYQSPSLNCLKLYQLSVINPSVTLSFKFIKFISLIPMSLRSQNHHIKISRKTNNWHKTINILWKNFKLLQFSSMLYKLQ